MKRVALSLLLLVVACLALSQSSEALVVGMSTQELTRESDIVIRGRVVGIKAQQADTFFGIVTKATVEIVDVVKGTLRQRRVIVEYDGGEIEGKEVVVSDAPRMEAGEEVLLFLESGRARRPHENRGASLGFLNVAYRVVGDAQGKYRIDERGIARKDGFSLVSDDGAEGKRADGKAGDLIDNEIPVTHLIKKIKTAATGRRGSAARRAR